MRRPLFIPHRISYSPWHECLIVAVLVAVALGCNTRTESDVGGAPKNAQSGETGDPAFHPKTIVPRPFPVIKDVAVGTATEVSDVVEDNDLVLGVEINGVSRAYPVSMLEGPTREVINDRLGDVAIAATWWGLCFNGIVYARQVEGVELDFAVSGKLWNRGLVMIDMQTQSLWPQLLGKSLQGQLQGTQLRRIPSTLTTWKSWRQAHPQTSVIMMTPIRKFDLERFENANEFVIGLARSGGAKAWTFPQLLERGVINDDFLSEPVAVMIHPSTSTALVYSRSANDRVLTFERGGLETILVDEETGSSWDTTIGMAVDGPLKGARLQQLPATVSYLHSWNQFHPKTEYWKRPPER